MQEVTVLQEVSDRKHNLSMPEKIGFPAPKRNSHKNFYHLDWTDLFLSTASRECTCWLSPKV